VLAVAHGGHSTAAGVDDSACMDMVYDTCPFKDPARLALSALLQSLSELLRLVSK